VIKINSIFVFLAKQHAALYVLFGVILALSIISRIGYQNHMQVFKETGGIGFLFFGIHFFMLRIFYEKYEIGRRNLRISNRGVITSHSSGTTFGSPLI